MATSTAEPSHEPPRHSLTAEQLSVLRRFCGGTVGGVMQAACSHPFDTIKSRVQNGVFPDIASCVKDTWAREGVFGFYRGVTPPLFLGGVYNSILFSLNQRMNVLMTPADHDPKKPLPLWRTALAAQLTAPLYVLTITPMEKIKVQLQVQGKGGVETSVTGPISCIRRVVSTEGWVSLLSGYVPTVMSRIIGLPCYFMGFQVTRGHLMETRVADTTTGRQLIIPMTGGIMAGICFWCSNYPCDFVKTQLQASKVKLSMLDVIRATYKRGGIKAFYKGFTACLLRSAPANASVWLGVDMTTRFLTNHGW